MLQNNGLLMASLGIGLRNQQLESFMVTVEPGVGNTSESIVYPGQEFVYCLVGDIQYQIGGQIYDLKSGDSVLFEAAQPHSFPNIGKFPAQLLLIFQVVEGGYWTQQRHLEG